jgi:hypothetical protein
MREVDRRDGAADCLGDMRLRVSTCLLLCLFCGVGTDLYMSASPILLSTVGISSVRQLLLTLNCNEGMGDHGWCEELGYIGQPWNHDGACAFQGPDASSPIFKPAALAK